MAMPLKKVDRQTTTPSLLRLFYREGAFPPLSDFVSPSTPHLELYTWPTCTLRELSHLIVTSLSALLPTPAIGTRLSFRLIFPDTRSPAPTASSTAPGRYLFKDLGSVIVGDGGPGIPSADEKTAAVVKDGIVPGDPAEQPERTLQDGRFIIGDYVAVAILPPLANGDVGPPLVAEVSELRPSIKGRPRDRTDAKEYLPERAGGFRGRGRGGFGQLHANLGGGGLPNGEWRRGEAVPAGPTSNSRRGGHGQVRGRDRW
ncbi:MAG: hypothetical protein M1818_004671 [Claussenomyces sp. TS43310]|nr:MAG: hypothetical protein M1818_004671 [Claussenomyces sp. TS43310]